MLSCVMGHELAIEITHTFNGLLSGTTQVSQYQKGKTNWILLKQETVSGSGISWAICKSAPHSRQITTPAPHHSVFYRPDALPATQPIVSKYWNKLKWIVHHKFLCVIVRQFLSQHVSCSALFSFGSAELIAECLDSTCTISCICGVWMLGWCRRYCVSPVIPRRLNWLVMASGTSPRLKTSTLLRRNRTLSKTFLTVSSCFLA